MPYAVPSVGRGVSNLLTSVVPYLGLIAAACFALRISIALAACPLAARGRVPVAHVHRLPRLRARLVPAVASARTPGSAPRSACSSTPRSRCWRHEHAIHHATAGDLDRRGVGDVQTLTVDEYRAKPWWGRLGYRLFRNPIVMFGLGPLWVVAVRATDHLLRGAARPRPQHVSGPTSRWRFAIVALCLLLGWTGFLLVQLPALRAHGRRRDLALLRPAPVRGHLLAAHRRVELRRRGAQGSSYLKLPKILQFLTGNIGLHHVHHLSARIPNYNLQARTTRTRSSTASRRSPCWDGLRATRLKLWDEQHGKLVGFGAARGTRAGAELSTTPLRPTPR